MKEFVFGCQGYAWFVLLIPAFIGLMIYFCNEGHKKGEENWGQAAAASATLCLGGSVIIRCCRLTLALIRPRGVPDLAS